MGTIKKLCKPDLMKQIDEIELMAANDLQNWRRGIF